MKKQYNLCISIFLTFFWLGGLEALGSGIRFLDARALYDHKVDDEWVIRRSIVNAVDLSYRIHANSMGATSVVFRTDYSSVINEGISTIKGNSSSAPTPYWDSVLRPPFVIKTFLEGFIFPIIAFHNKNDSVEDDYPKILIAFHGTAEPFHWATNISGICPKCLTLGPGGREVLSGHSGFLSAGLSIDIDDFKKSASSLMPSTVSLESCQIIVTGHSLGGAVASVFSLRLLDALKRLDNSTNTIVSITMGQPPVWSKLSISGAFTGWDAHDKVGTLMGGKNVLRLVTNANGKEDMVAHWGTHPALGASTSVFAVLFGVPLSTLTTGNPFGAFYNHGVFDTLHPVNLDLERGDYTSVDLQSWTFPHDMKFYKAGMGLQKKKETGVVLEVASDTRIEVPRVLGPAVPDIAVGYEDVYLRFVKGYLVYRPNPKNNVGRVELPIGAFPNPLEGTFDLSRFVEATRNAAGLLTVSVGYKKERSAVNLSRVEVWVVPKFIVEKDQATIAAHFSPIIGEFIAPVGLFWTTENDEDLKPYDYLVASSLDEIASKSLYHLWSEKSFPRPQNLIRRIGGSHDHANVTRWPSAAAGYFLSLMSIKM